jgi:hypothetical protein
MGNAFNEEINMRWDRFAFAIGACVVVAASAAVLAEGKGESAPAKTEWKNFDEMQAFYVKSFVESDNFGERRMPALETHLPVTIAGKTYLVQKVQLVSLLKNDPPKVYDNTYGNPARKELKDTKLRDMTEFEKKALADIKKGKAVVSDTAGKTPVVMGALRAQESCIECHKGTEKGALMGAFTYTLYEVKKEEKKAPPPAL